MKKIKKVVVIFLTILICFQAILPPRVYAYTYEQTLTLYKTAIDRKVREYIEIEVDDYINTYYMWEGGPDIETAKRNFAEDVKNGSANTGLIQDWLEYDIVLASIEEDLKHYEGIEMYSETWTCYLTERQYQQIKEDKESGIINWDSLHDEVLDYGYQFYKEDSPKLRENLTSYVNAFSSSILYSQAEDEFKNYFNNEILIPHKKAAEQWYDFSIESDYMLYLDELGDWINNCCNQFIDCHYADFYSLELERIYSPEGKKAYDKACEIADELVDSNDREMFLDSMWYYMVTVWNEDKQLPLDDAKKQVKFKLRDINEELDFDQSVTGLIERIDFIRGLKIDRTSDIAQQFYQDVEQIKGRMTEEDRQKLDVNAVIDEFIEENVTYITLEQAKNSIMCELSLIINELEGEMEGVDSQTKNNAILQHFQHLKNNWQTSGDFYNYVIILKNMLESNNDQQTFMSNIPTYIEEFIQTNLQGTTTQTENVITTQTGNGVWDILFGAVDGVAGIFMYLTKVLFIIIPGVVIQLIETMLGSIGTETNLEVLTLESIFFNRLALVDINIFDFATAGSSTLRDGNVLLNIRQNIANWYYAIRNLAIVFGLVVLIYIGIRMAMSNIADDKAKYKKMLMDWLVSFALIFILHYLMIFIIQLNDGIVDVLYNARSAQETKISQEIPLINFGTSQGLDIRTKTLQGRLLLEAFTISATRSMSSALLYVMLVAMTFLFLVVYIKRFITISFLVIISPLITITYAIDKSGDGKAQALNKWLKEFVFNIIIQPFHCIIYMVFLQNIMYVINNTTVIQFGNVIVAIMMMGFIYKAEDIVKAIFGFEASNLGSAAMVGAAVISKASKAVNKVAGAAGSVKGAGNKAAEIKNIQNPNSLPGRTGNNSSNSKPSQGAKLQQAQSQSGAGTSANKESKLKKLGKSLLPGSAAQKIPRALAGKAMTAALGYGLTGNSSQGLAVGHFINKTKGSMDNISLNNQVKNRKNDTLDAYQAYKEANGLTSEEMQKKSRELLNADIDTIDDNADRNLAGWLQAYSQTQGVLGADNPVEEVMRQLQDYEIGRS